MPALARPRTGWQGGRCRLARTVEERGVGVRCGHGGSVARPARVALTRRRSGSCRGVGRPWPAAAQVLNSSSMAAAMEATSRLSGRCHAPSLGTKRTEGSAAARASPPANGITRSRR